jgi:hypothetical protein
MQTRSALVGLMPIASAFGPRHPSPNTVTPCFSWPLECKCGHPCSPQEIKEARSNDQSRVDLSFQIPGSEDPDELMEALELFGEKVLPHIRDI